MPELRPFSAFNNIEPAEPPISVVVIFDIPFFWVPFRNSDAPHLVEQLVCLLGEPTIKHLFSQSPKKTNRDPTELFLGACVSRAYRTSIGTKTLYLPHVFRIPCSILFKIALKRRQYLSRYTHRVAISNRRLVAADDGGVSFRWKDYRIEGPGRWKTMTLAPHEFIRRFLMHVLPKGFHRIRHYGLFANGNRAEHRQGACLLNLSIPGIVGTLGRSDQQPQDKSA